MEEKSIKTSMLLWVTVAWKIYSGFCPLCLVQPLPWPPGSQCSSPSSSNQMDTAFEIQITALKIHHSLNLRGSSSVTSLKNGDWGQKKKRGVSKTAGVRHQNEQMGLQKQKQGNMTENKKCTVQCWCISFFSHRKT